MPLVRDTHPDLDEFGDYACEGTVFSVVMHAGLRGADTLDRVDLDALWREDPTDAMVGRAVL